MSFCRFLVAFLVFAGIDQGQCLQLSITPRKGIESLTKNVTFSCRTDIGSTSRPLEIFLIQITKGDQESVALLRGNGAISYGKKEGRRLHADGQIDNRAISGGYLNVTLHFPSTENTGQYRCHVVYLNNMNVTRQDSDDAYLYIDENSNSKFEARINGLEALVHAVSSKMDDIDDNVGKIGSLHAFSASINQNAQRGGKYYVSVGKTVIFNEVITRIGQGYDSGSGIFTAPVDGVYAFFLVIEVEGDAGVGFSLRTTDEREFARLYVEDKDVGDQSSVSSVVNLKAGEKVKVQVHYKTDKGTGHMYHNKYCVFSGFLIRET